MSRIPPKLGSTDPPFASFEAKTVVSTSRVLEFHKEKKRRTNFAMMIFVLLFMSLIFFQG